MSNYTVATKNSAKVDLRKIKQSNLKKQFEEVIQTLKEDPYMPTQSFEKLRPTHEGRINFHNFIFLINFVNHSVLSIQPA